MPAFRKDPYGWVYEHVRTPRRAGILALLAFVGAFLIIRFWWITPQRVWSFAFAGDVGAGSRARTAELRQAAWDWLPFVGIPLLACGALVGAAIEARDSFEQRLTYRLSKAAMWILILLLPMHAVESALMVGVAGRGAHEHTLLLALQAVVFVELALLPVAGVVALLGALIAAGRAARRSVRAGKPVPAGSVAADGGDVDHWVDSSRLPDERRAAVAADGNALGICLSGGGIRSATFGLGAVQALQVHHEVGRARYITAVSGGAYAAGALLLAVHPPKAKLDVPPCPDVTFDNAFAPGSPEFDHLRKHSSYIADGLREWCAAAAAVVRGAVAATAFLLLLTFVAGRWAGMFYQRIGQQGALQSGWYPLWGPVFATAVLAVLAFLAWYLSSNPKVAQNRVLNRGLGDVAFAASLAVAVLVLLGAGVPIVASASQRVLDWAGLASGQVAGTFARGGILGVVGILTTGLGLLNRQRITVTRSVQGVRGRASGLGDTGRRLLAWLPVVGGLALVGVVYLSFFGYIAADAARLQPGDRWDVIWGTPHWTLPLTHLQLDLAATALLVLLYLAVDETAAGLHPFYRRRLASAFAVYRGRRPDAARSEAVPYPWSVSTELAAFGTGGRREPQVIFCASAHCSDPEFTPPGRHVLPFTLSRDYVGGPEVGWCSTSALTGRSRGRLTHDVTVEAAMAVSGAAFASAEGANHVPANTLLALTNARLGTWMASPRLVDDLEHCRTEWWQPRVPRVRRLSYLLREVFAWYPAKPFPLVFVTDGAHYEALGLVELLRHRCREIYCFDATSDTEAWAAALAHAVFLAYDELGVRIELEAPDASQPGRPDGAPLDEVLRDRLVRQPIITATIDYPPLQDVAPAEHAVLVIGRAALYDDAPWELKRHAARHRLFPNDTTGDQWFDDAKFNAYTELGRSVGELAWQAMQHRRVPPRADDALDRTLRMSPVRTETPAAAPVATPVAAGRHSPSSATAVRRTRRTSGRAGRDG